MAESFRLTRNYSVASFIGIALVAIALVTFYHYSAVESLMGQEGKSNSEMGRTLANTLWPKYSHFLQTAGQLPLTELRQREELKQLHLDVLEKVAGLRVVKVKIYDMQGVVVFSTQRSQIGDNKSDNAGFLMAREGKTVNEINYRDEFSAYEREVYDRSLVSSYIPLKQSFDSPVQGVFEIYSDVTPLLADINTTGYLIVIVVVGLLLLLYLFLLLIVRRADKMIQHFNKEQEELQKQRIDYLAEHDELTGLYNRNGVLRKLHAAKKHSLNVDSGLGVMKIKLLRLKAINDSLGHSVGDRVLADAGRRILTCAPGGNAVGRNDGDEFLMVLNNLLSEKEVGFIVEKLHEMFAEPFVIDDQRIEVVIAIGICTDDNTDYTVEQLMMNAGTALAEAEHSPMRRYVLFDSALEGEKREQFELEQDLNRAIAKREFVLFYQPRVDAESGRVCGMEALLRWQHPKRGLVMPGDFIELLENGGGIVSLGGWLLQEACSQCRAWLDEGEVFRVAVNVSLKQLYSESFTQTVAAALENSGLPPSYLELELTESLLAKDRHQVEELLNELKRLGVTLSIDDFGTGYSSLSYLMHFPVDCIKIDRSFVRDITDNTNHAAITSAIVAMAKTLNLKVVAEGVEDGDQLAFLQQLGCDEWQGFFFSKPVPAGSFFDVVGVINSMPYSATAVVTH